MELSKNQRELLLQNANQQFTASIELKQKVLSQGLLDKLVTMAGSIVSALAKEGKLMICGNGGSAADAQHLAAELLVRLKSHVNRDSIPAISLALDTSTITACGNDYGFECLYERMVQGLGKKGDVLLGISTSGRSQNVIRALKMARKKGIMTLGFLGGDGGPMLQDCDEAFIVPSKAVDRIQESHITAGHILMELIEGLMLEREHISLR